MAGFEISVQFHFHIVKLDLHPIQQRIVAGRSRGDFIQCVNHFDNAVQNALGQHQAQIPRRRRQGWFHRPLINPFLRASSAPFQITEALHDSASAQHI